MDFLLAVWQHNSDVKKYIHVSMILLEVTQPYKKVRYVSLVGKINLADDP